MNERRSLDDVILPMTMRATIGYGPLPAQPEPIDVPPPRHGRLPGDAERSGAGRHPLPECAARTRSGAGGRGRFKATAVVSDRRLATRGTTGTSDAICMELDHRDGYLVTMLFRYRIEQGKPVMGEVTALSGERGIFPQA